MVKTLTVIFGVNVVIQAARLAAADTTTGRVVIGALVLISFAVTVLYGAIWARGWRPPRNLDH